MQAQPQGAFYGKGLPSNMMGALRNDDSGEPDGFPMAASQGEVVGLPTISANMFGDGSSGNTDPTIGTGVGVFRGGQRFKKASSHAHKKKQQQYFFCFICVLKFEKIQCTVLNI